MRGEAVTTGAHRMTNGVKVCSRSKGWNEMFVCAVVSWTESKGGQSVGPTRNSGAEKRHQATHGETKLSICIEVIWLTRYSATAEEDGSQRSSKSGLSYLLIQAGLEDKIWRPALSNHCKMIIKINWCGETKRKQRGWIFLEVLWFTKGKKWWVAGYLLKLWVSARWKTPALQTAAVKLRRKWQQHDEQ